MAWFRNILGDDKPEYEDIENGALERKIEEAIHRHDRIFRGSQGYGFLDWDVERGKIHWDGGFWRRLGYSETDMERISDSNHFMEYVHQDDRDTLSKKIRQHLKIEGPTDITIRLRKKRGGTIWTELRIDALRDSTGYVRFVSGIIYDVTKLKQTEQALLISEARHARIIRASNDGIWEWSAEHGGFHFSNRCWEILGYADSDDVVNQGVDRVQAWRKRMHPEDLSIFDKVLDDHIMKRGPFDVEYRILAKDGTYRWIRGRGQMSFNDRGEPARMSGTNMDITELKLAEEKVLQAKEAAEKANQAKSDFLSSMSHELRTPLNAILGFTQLLEMDAQLNKDQLKNLNEINKAGQHLLQLIGDVLDLAKIEAGHMSFSMEATLPSRLINECVGLVKTLAEERKVTISVNFNGLENELVFADAVRAKQIYLNLFSNAVKYNRPGGNVEIMCSRTKEKFLRVEVRDTGKGIPKKLQKDMFQPFNRLGVEMSNIEGSGVGLVITKQLVEQMGGSVGFNSVEDIGSCFWVDLRSYEDGSTNEKELRIEIDKAISAGASQETSQDIPKESQGEAITLAPSLQFSEAKKILYVEDNPPNQRLMQQIINRFDLLDLDVVDEALRGLYFARTHQPDLIILDINLPGMDGYETVEVLKKDAATSQIPVVALTANAMAHDVRKGEASGFDRYLTKPVNIAQLIDVFNELLS